MPSVADDGLSVAVEPSVAVVEGSVVVGDGVTVGRTTLTGAWLHSSGATCMHREWPSGEYTFTLISRPAKLPRTSVGEGVPAGVVGFELSLRATYLAWRGSAAGEDGGLSAFGFTLWARMTLAQRVLRGWHLLPGS